MAGSAFVCGGVAGAAGILATQPLDTLRIRMQTKSGGANASSLLREAGMRGLYAGIGAPLATAGARSACIFLGYDAALKSIGGQSPLDHALAGAIGALAAVPITNPTEIVKCHAQLVGATAPRGSGLATEWNLLRNLLRQGGPQSLLVGLPLTAVRDMTYRSTHFALYELMAQTLEGKSRKQSGGPRPWHICLTCGCIAGVVAWLPVYPIDVVKTHWQTGRRFGATTLSGMLQRGLQAEGPGWLTKGAAPTLMRGGSMNAVIFCVYESLQRRWCGK